MSVNSKTTERFLIEHSRSGAVSFHMPGHKGSGIYRETGHGDFLKCMMDGDITEIPGADNLFHNNGILADTARAYGAIYGVKKSYLLVNGTSCGIIAGILACVGEGDTLIMARNSHKSVYNAARLGGIRAEFVYPSMTDGLAGPVAPEDVAEAFDRCPDAAAVILPSPNYYGICSDIKAIADIVHERGGILIVDQAHGAHLKMMEGLTRMPLSAETGGADIIINSTHKTLASFTQSAVMNVNSDRVSLDKIEDRLQMIESSSPSYILMGSLDINRSIIEEQGERLFRRWASCVDRFYREAAAIPGIRVMNNLPFLDRTKLNIDATQLGMSGADLAEELLKRSIVAELATGGMVMCMTGIGTTDEHIDRLIRALTEISEEFGSMGVINSDLSDGAVSEEVWTRRHLQGECAGKTERINVNDAAGMCAADYIIPYPPGVPLVCRGEIITAEDCDYVSGLVSRGEDVLGVDSLGMVKVYVTDEK